MALTGILKHRIWRSFARGWITLLVLMLCAALSIACKSTNPLPHRPPHSGTTAPR
jgi:hypothetical protein